jgi:hypothetical protein
LRTGRAGRARRRRNGDTGGGGRGRRRRNDDTGGGGHERRQNRVGSKLSLFFYLRVFSTAWIGPGKRKNRKRNQKRCLAGGVLNTILYPRYRI